MAQYEAIPPISRHDKPEEEAIIILHIMMAVDGMLQACWLWLASHRPKGEVLTGRVLRPQDVGEHSVGLLLDLQYLVHALPKALRHAGQLPVHNTHTTYCHEIPEC